MLPQLPTPELSVTYGSPPATHNAGNRDEHDILTDVALGHDYRRAQGGTGQIGEGKARQDNVTTREG